MARSSEAPDRPSRAPGADEPPVLAVVVSGGPAPGINAVISAATIEAVRSGCGVLGILDGFEWLCRADTGRVRALSIEDVEGIHLDGGSILGTSRADPTRSKDDLQRVLEALRRLDVSFLLTIGGDGTAYTAYRLQQAGAERLAVAHVPKTIDNDVPLPPSVPTLGYETARHVGTEIVENLQNEARTGRRWVVVVTMGRNAGHLALGIGASSGADLVLIPEEFAPGSLGLAELADIVEGSIVKRRSTGSEHGVAVVAEGVGNRIRPEDLEAEGILRRDRYGQIKVPRIDLARALTSRIRRSLEGREIDVRPIYDDLGYELRCADPIPLDVEYGRRLGFVAARHLLSGEKGAVISVSPGDLTPIPFEELLDRDGDRMRQRTVALDGEVRALTRSQEDRIEADELEDESRVAMLAGAARLSDDEFLRRFGRIV